MKNARFMNGTIRTETQGFRRLFWIPLFAFSLALTTAVYADPIWAEGGDEVYDYTSGGLTYRVHVFNSSGTFTVHEDLAALGDIRYLVVGGGGGGHGGTIGGG
ncbi:MAG: hypothetical protein K9N49_08110, partial [Candidatus Marinimicrobia bacterium]|nr:hypothetical protein [Candidatus Neomarinimicrobiota bacterium]